MFGNRRLAKRSIVGTKISAACQDGRFYTGVIQAVRSSPDAGETSDNTRINREYNINSPNRFSVTPGILPASSYCVKFENGQIQEVDSKSIIGPGFQTMSSVHLLEGQKVYVTLNGREVTGLVQRHDLQNNEVVIWIKTANSCEVLEISKKLDDVRLLESRKSARLVDQDQDYSKLADFQPEIKKRAVSLNIEVPAKHSRHRRSMGEETEPADDDMEVMDERMAALVLTSLSCSPASPKIPAMFGERSQSLPENQQSSSLTSSGVFSYNSDRSDPSPPLSNNTVPPGTGLSGSWPQDEGLDLEENVRSYYDEFPDELKRKKAQVQVRTGFQCTWPGCGKTHSTCAGIEKHVRIKHLRREDSELDGEEEFYYTEIEVSDDGSGGSSGHADNTIDCSDPLVPTVTSANTTLSSTKISSSSSAPTTITTPTNIRVVTNTHVGINLPISRNTVSSKAVFGIPDHDYQKKEHHYLSQSLDSSVRISGNYLNEGPSTPIPINMPQIKKSLSWQNRVNMTTSPGQSASAPVRMNKPSPQERLHQHQSQSPKCHMLTSPQKCTVTHKKSRSEVRKCRKVYGMENRDMWCTQCKWKKACSRFVD
ncbi:zinc finger protein 704-like [Argonauta hians]